MLAVIARHRNQRPEDPAVMPHERQHGNALRLPWANPFVPLD